MKKIISMVLLAGLFSSLLAQSKEDLATIARIRSEGFQNSQVMEILSYMLDVHGNRLVGSQGMQKAQLWARAKMAEMGLANTQIEAVLDHGVSWDNAYTSLHMMAPGYYPLTGFPLAYTPGTDGKIEAEVVIADIDSQDDIARLRGKLRGKIALVSPPLAIDPARDFIAERRTEDNLKSLLDPDFPAPGAARRPRVANPNQVSAEARNDFLIAEGALMLIECRSGRLGVVRTFHRPGAKKDFWARAGIVNSIPMVAVVPEQYNRMYRLVARGIPVRVEAEIRNRIGEPTRVNNVIGEIPGSDLRDEIVMIGAHFDSWHTSPGATDNASGCAVMLETMRILAAIDARPRRTVRIGLWSSEEDGIRGSRAYVSKHFGDPQTGVTAAYDKFSVYYNQDYGKGQFRGIYLQGNEHVRSIFTKWTELFNDLGMTTVSIRSVGSTDHIPFDRAGLPAFQFLQDRIGQGTGHTNLDFFENVVAEDLTKNAVILASFVYLSAMQDEKMPRKSDRPSS